MTREEIQNLQADAEVARAAAKLAIDDAAAHPDDLQKKAAADEAVRGAAEAEAKLAAATATVEMAAKFLSHLPSTDTTAETEAFKFRIIALGLYLLIMVLLCTYLLGGLMMAKTDEEEVRKIMAERQCCAAVNANSANTGSSVANSNANAGTNANLAQANVNAAAGNTNANVSSVNTNVNSAASNVNANTPGRPANASTGAANANAAAKATPDPNVPQPNIGKDVYIDIPFVVRSRIVSADSYLFFTVLFSGMLGGAIRAVHSLVRHLGLKNFSFHWTWFYISLPFVGGGLSEVIYFVIRGGFYGGSFGKGLVLNLFSFAALAALTGLFTDQAMEKLKQVAVTLLADTPPKVENAKEIQEKREAEKKN